MVTAASSYGRLIFHSESYFQVSDLLQKGVAAGIEPGQLLTPGALNEVWGCISRTVPKGHPEGKELLAAKNIRKQELLQTKGKERRSKVDDF